MAGATREKTAVTEEKDMRTRRHGCCDLVNVVFGLARYIWVTYDVGRSGCASCKVGGGGFDGSGRNIASVNRVNPLTVYFEFPTSTADRYPIVVTFTFMSILPCASQLARLGMYRWQLLETAGAMTKSQRPINPR